MMKDVSSFSILFCCYYFLFSIALLIISERVMVEQRIIHYISPIFFGQSFNYLTLILSLNFYWFVVLIMVIVCCLQLLPLIQIASQDAGFGHTSNLIALANQNTHQQFFPFQMIHTSYVCQRALKNVV